MGAQKNRLIETVLKTTHNTCFGSEVRKTILKHGYFVITGEKKDTATSFKVAEGKDLDITCNATRSAGGIVYWTKNETKSTFRQNGTILRFVNIRRGASGDYICHLQTDHNTTIVKVIKVDVQCKCILFSHVLSLYHPCLPKGKTFRFTPFT